MKTYFLKIGQHSKDRGGASYHGSYKHNPWLLPIPLLCDYLASCVPGDRGGARNARQPQQTSEIALRQAMQTSALQKIAEACPGVDERTARTLLRSEARTTTSLLNARSHQQVKHIMVAALKRAGLSTIAREVEEMRDGSPNQTREEQQHQQQHDTQHNDEHHEEHQPSQPSNDSMTQRDREIQKIYAMIEESAHKVQTMEAVMAQMTTLLHTQYVAAMRFDLTPLILAMQANQQNGKIRLVRCSKSLLT